MPRGVSAIRRGTPLICAMAVGLALLRLSWDKWLHPVIDFGRELYVPWQILAGRALLVDLSYFNGPLSPTVNALGFRLFGVGLTTLVWLNIVILVVVVALLHDLLGRFARPSTSLVGLVVFLSCFALADPSGSGTYNFIAPYSHEMTHGFLLSLLALSALVRHADRPSPAKLTATAVATGLVFLTKSELFVALFPAVALGCVLVAIVDSGTGKGMSRPLVGGIFVAGTAAPVVVAWILLGIQSGFEHASTGVLGSWRFALSSRLHDLPFYRAGMGLRNPVASLGELLLWSAIWLLILAPAWVLGRRTDSSRSWRKIAFWVAASVSALSTWVALSNLSVLDISRPLPLVLTALVGALAWRSLAEYKRSPPSRKTIVAGLVVTLFALLLLLKVFLRVRLSHYGFVLAAPATMILVWLLLEGIPIQLQRRGGSGKAFRLAGVAFLAVVVIFHLALTVRSYQGKTFPVGAGRDAFLADGTGRVVARTMERLEVLVGPEESFAVLPEGVMLNYLLRRPNPTPYYNFMPPELVMFGQESIIEAFERDTPEWIVMMGRGATEYGYRYLGKGYGELLADWIRGRFRVVEEVRPDPGADRSVMSWALILRRAEPNESATSQ